MHVRLWKCCIVASWECWTLINRKPKSTTTCSTPPMLPEKEPLLEVTKVETAWLVTECAVRHSAPREWRSSVTSQESWANCLTCIVSPSVQWGWKHCTQPGDFIKIQVKQFMFRCFIKGNYNWRISKTYPRMVSLPYETYSSIHSFTKHLFVSSHMLPFRRHASLGDIRQTRHGFLPKEFYKICLEKPSWPATSWNGGCFLLKEVLACVARS